MKQRRWRLAGAAMLVGTLAVTAATLAVENELQRLGPPSLATAQDVSTVVIDRDGKLLRAFTTSEGRWRLPVTRADVDQRYLQLLFAFEDKRFETHAGIDYLAIARAGWQFVLRSRDCSFACG